MNLEDLDREIVNSLILTSNERYLYHYKREKEIDGCNFPLQADTYKQGFNDGVAAILAYLPNGITFGPNPRTQEAKKE